MSLKDGTKKLSKSDPSDLSRINLTDTESDIINKIRKAKTDTNPFPANISDLNSRPEIENLLGIYASLNGNKIEDLLAEFKDQNFNFFKEQLSKLIVGKISPISKQIKKLMQNTSYIDQVLRDGSEKANELSSKKLADIKKKFGF